MRALLRCPPVGLLQILVKRDGLAGMVRYLNDRDPLIVPILRMLVADTPAHIRGLSLGSRETERLPSSSDSWVFVFKSGALQREAEFQEMRESRGSFFAFHGSPLCNWHVVLKTGLLNMSSSKYMTTGAVLGPGIYFADDAGTSAGYSRVGTTWPKSMMRHSPDAYARMEGAAVPGGPPTSTEGMSPKEIKMRETSCVCLLEEDEKNSKSLTSASELSCSSRVASSLCAMALCELIPALPDMSDYSSGGQGSQVSKSRGMHVLKAEN